MELDLEQLYRERFGFIAPPRQMEQLGIVVPEPFPIPVASPPEIIVDTYGFLGVPLMMPVKIDDYQLPNEPMVSISGGKNITTTEINGIDGTFKEEWTLRDYEITIRGFAIDMNNPENLPEKTLREIRAFCEKKKSRKIVCRLTALFNISLISIDSWELSYQAGSIGMPEYTIKGKSDREFELEIKPTA